MALIKAAAAITTGEVQELEGVESHFIDINNSLRHEEDELKGLSAHHCILASKSRPIPPHHHVLQRKLSPTTLYLLAVECMAHASYPFVDVVSETFAEVVRYDFDFMCPDQSRPAVPAQKAASIAAECR